jgi:hypothetical protein
MLALTTIILNLIVGAMAKVFDWVVNTATFDIYLYDHSDALLASSAVFRRRRNVAAT